MGEVRTCHVRRLNKGVRSEMYNRFKFQAETIAKDTMFSNVASLEVIQGLSRLSKLTMLTKVLLASWGDVGWRPGSKY